MEKQLDRVTNKAYRTLLTCRGPFGITWGLRSKVVHWIYTMVVRPIVTYAATVWWLRIRARISRAKLSIAKDNLLGYYWSNQDSSNSCN
jgi:hypothetical protein